MKKIKKFEDLIGCIFTSVTSDGESVTFKLDDGRTARLFHDQLCCECVGVEDIAGDLDALVASVVVRAEENTSCDFNNSAEGTWTFYRIQTEKGLVVIRFFGEASYYSESVDFNCD